jgi:hypothetical protein
MLSIDTHPAMKMSAEAIVKYGGERDMGSCRPSDSGSSIGRLSDSLSSSTGSLSLSLPGTGVADW